MEELFPRIRSYLERTVDEFLIPFYDKLAEYSTVDISTTEALQAIEELRRFYEQTWQCHFMISFPWTSLAIELEQLYGQITGAEAPRKSTTIFREL